MKIEVTLSKDELIMGINEEYRGDAITLAHIVDQCTQDYNALRHVVAELLELLVDADELGNLEEYLGYFKRKKAQESK